MNELIHSLEWRYAVKQFDSQKKIPADTWQKLEKALQLTPSSYGLQPWKFYIVQDMKLREALKAVSWNQKQVTDCSHYVVFTQKIEMSSTYVAEYMQSIADTRNIPISTLDGFKNAVVNDITNGPRSKYLMEWMARQSYIALGNFMTSAAVLGVDTCPMEGLDPLKYDEILDLNNSGYKTVMACAAGFRDNNDPLSKAKKVRFSLEKVIKNI